MLKESVKLGYWSSSPFLHKIISTVEIYFNYITLSTHGFVNNLINWFCMKSVGASLVKIDLMSNDQKPTGLVQVTADKTNNYLLHHLYYITLFYIIYCCIIIFYLFQRDLHRLLQVELNLPVTESAMPCRCTTELVQKYSD